MRYLTMRCIIWMSAVLLSMCGYAQRSYQFGTVKKASSNEWMIGVHVQNKTAGLITSTNPNGTFKIPAKPGDTLKVSYIGFETVLHIINPEEFGIIDLQLHQQPVQLSEVEVNVFPEYVRFKEIILETVPDQPFTVELPALVAGYRPATAQELHNPNLAPRAGMSFNLDGLTKKGRERKKLKKLLANETERKEAYQKFNREWISSETQLTGDDLTDFIAFCNFSVEYLSKASLFEIKTHMMALLADFHDKNGMTPNPGA